MIEIGQYYTGAASYYQKKNDIIEFEYGLNVYVNRGSPGVSRPPPRAVAGTQLAGLVPASTVYG